MKKGRLIALIVLLSPLLAGLSAGEPEPNPAAPERAAVRFAVFEVTLDCGEHALGAYQVDVRAGANMSLVGIEGGESAAFSMPPYYDPKALAEGGGGRVAIGAYSVLGELPVGQTRVARLHFQIVGADALKFEASIRAAADGAGARIPTATVSITRSEGSAP